MVSVNDEGRRALESVQAAWNHAARHWNPTALAEIYTEDALFFGGRPGHTVGASAIRDYFASYEGVIESATMELVEQHLVELAPRCFLAQGFVDFVFSLTGQRITRSTLRSTLIIVLQDPPKIRQHHFSASPAAPPLGG
jgi:ketosteroid isomerase-like protein